MPTNAPGHSASSRLSNCALTRTVPEPASTALSTKSSRPTLRPRLSGSTAVTWPPPLRKVRSASPRLRCGRLKATAIGSSWVIVTSGVPVGCTVLPTKTLIAPARPAVGAMMRLYDRPTWAASIAARSDATTARCESTTVWLVSTAPCEMKFCANRSRLRASWRSASASAAWSFASCARACVTLASSVRESSVNSSCPALTNWPSRMCTLVITLLTCGRMSTLFSAVTVPVASSITSTSRCRASAVLTLTGPPRPAEAAAAGARAGDAAPTATPPGRVAYTPTAMTTAAPAIHPHSARLIGPAASRDGSCGQLLSSSRVLWGSARERDGTRSGAPIGPARRPPPPGRPRRAPAQARPVEPKPPAPRCDASKSSTTRKLACTTGTITSCAMRSNGCTVNAAAPRFQQLTISGPW